MKRNLPSFLAGSLTTLLVCSLSISALAISGRMTIEVDPINVQVNGEVFEPKDAKGNSVPVFAYNGTTYAPLRALAEAYGLEVGYDKESNMATVGAVNTESPDTVFNENEVQDYNFDYSYEEFKGLWETELTGAGATLIFCAVNDDEVLAWWDGATEDILNEYILNVSKEYPVISVYFQLQNRNRLAQSHPQVDEVEIMQMSHEAQ